MHRYAATLVEDVEFSCEDACRSDPDLMCEVLKEVIAAGARTLNIPDTVGFTTPREYQASAHTALTLDSLAQLQHLRHLTGMTRDATRSCCCHHAFALTLAQFLWCAESRP